MFKKIFEYAGPYKKNMYVATVVVLVSVLLGVFPFVAIDALKALGAALLAKKLLPLLSRG